MNLTADIENLTPARRALLELRLKKKARPVTPVTPVAMDQPIRRRENPSSAPLSFNQESLWFLEQLNPHSSLYNLYDAVRLHGPLDFAALQQALETIIARHETLRTTIINADGRPLQIISAHQPVELPLFDLRQCAEAEETVQRLLVSEAERPFDLAHGPLLRHLLIRLGEQDHILLVTMHHIVSDGWSIGVFWQELTQLYASFSASYKSHLPELPLQFGDVAASQRENIKGEAFKQQLDYWKTKLAGAPALLELPADRPRAAVQSFRGAQLFTLLPEDLSQDLRALSQREGVTLFMTLLTAFKALLARYTGADDLVVGSPIAGRTRSETENLIGFFVNTLVLRTDLSGDPTFREALQRVRETALAAYDHQDLSFDRLVAELQPERSLSYNPLFQTAFALQSELSGDRKLSGLKLTPLKLGSVTAKFDLFVSLSDTPDGLRVTAEYSTDLFDPSTMQRFLGHYQNLLTGIVSNPARRISELPLLTEAERHQVLVEWNDTQRSYPDNACLQQLFEAQVARTPDAVAVQSEEMTLTYRELNQRANQLAHYLQAAGIGPDRLVGIFTERSLLTVIGILGILKAGGAYLPLDTTYPRARLSFMLADAEAPVILTQQKLLLHLPDHSATVVCLDSDWEMISQESEADPVSQAKADSLAYIIYTSGSTGRPKGVSIPHRAVSRLVFNTNYVQLDSTDRIAQISNISFDAATFELWGALLHGARLVLINKDVALSPREFAGQLRDYGINTIFLTTALFNLLAREVPTAFSSVRQLMIGGEAVDPYWINEVLRQGPPERLLNVYGPTESTTFATWHLVKEVPEGATTIPIGRPISNTQIYLLDRYLNPVPVGVHGELYLGGDGLAREYLKRPELTAEKFIEWSDNGETPALRLYKTGDVARYLPDGSLEYLGRTDHQVKLRGFRIETGEIETALSAHPAVQESVVAVIESVTREKALAAWYVAPPDALTPTGELRDYLRQRLPDYMIPATFTRLNNLPLTPNGKVDRNRLPAPNETLVESGSEFIEPKDELELRLMWIWRKVLGHQTVGIRDNFFDLGGHSLIAVRLFTEIAKTFGKRLPLAILFQAPTIEQLAAILRQQGWQPSWASLVPLRSSGTRPPFFCVHAVGGNVLEYHELARFLDHDQPFYGLQSRGLDGQCAPLTSIEEMASDYLKEVRDLQPEGPYYLGGRSFGGSVAFEMARQLREQGQEVALLAMLDTYPFGWQKLFPRATVLSSEARFTLLRIRQHLRNIQQLNLSGIIAYILGKAKYKKRKYENRVWRLKKKFSKKTERQMTDTIRDLEGSNYLALKKYVPQIYSGKVTFFCASEEVSATENRLGWEALAAGGVEVIEVPGDHQTMIKEPAVMDLANRLQGCLSTAQGMNRNS